MKKLTLYGIFLCIVILISGCQEGRISEDESKRISEMEKKSILKKTESKKFRELLQSKPVTFLLLGIDSRGEEKSRTDSILVAQYDAINRTLKLASLMRDSYVKIPGQEQYDKLNQAYFIGGEDLLIQTIKDNFNMDIDYAVTIDFEGFIQVMDLIVPDGLTVHVKKEMIDDMNLSMKPGLHSLHGEDLLKYVRFRHDEESDFGRVRRQQEVLLQIKEKIYKEMTTLEGFAKLPNIVDTALPYVESDLKVSEILTLGTTMFLQPIEKVETIRIPVSGGFTNQTYPHAGAVLELDFSKNKEALMNFFSEPKAVNE